MANTRNESYQSGDSDGDLDYVLRDRSEPQAPEQPEEPPVVQIDRKKLFEKPRPGRSNWQEPKGRANLTPADKASGSKWIAANREILGVSQHQATEAQSPQRNPEPPEPAEPVEQQLFDPDQQ